MAAASLSAFPALSSATRSVTRIAAAAPASALVVTTLLRAGMPIQSWASSLAFATSSRSAHRVSASTFAADTRL